MPKLERIIQASVGLEDQDHMPSLKKKQKKYSYA